MKSKDGFTLAEVLISIALFSGTGLGIVLMMGHCLQIFRLSEKDVKAANIAESCADMIKHAENTQNQESLKGEVSRWIHSVHDLPAMFLWDHQRKEFYLPDGLNLSSFWTQSHANGVSLDRISSHVDDIFIISLQKNIRFDLEGVLQVSMQVEFPSHVSRDRRKIHVYQIYMTSKK